MKKINGIKWKKLLESGVNALSNNKQRINALNVFPIPDGDTGSNMSSTVEYAFKEIKNLKTESISEISSKFSKGTLLGSRGNSGVILSQIFKGISVGMEKKIEVTSFDIVESLYHAKEYAYKSVTNPVEGTILTVIKTIYEKLSESVTVSHTIEETLKLATKFAKKATKDTPKFLPILEEVGVVDSGGEGLSIFIEGMYLCLIGKKVNPKKEIERYDNKPKHEGEFGYCTEILLNLKFFKSFDKNKVEKELSKLGNSIVIIQEDQILKLHIHSHKPGNILNFVMKYGECTKIKIDNMTIQANESNSHKETKENEVENNIALISCNTGQGIIFEMKEMGAHFIIESGQTSNPSAKEFIKAINSINAEKIIILPNNSNIILAAQQAAQISEKEIIVINSKTQMEGLTAIMNFNSDASLKENKEEIQEALQYVKTGQVTKAIKTTKIEGINIIEGNYLAIAERKIIQSTKTKIKAAIEISKKLIDDNTEIITIYYGENATKTDSQEIASYIENNYEVEVEIKSGGQRVYNFLISYE